MKRADHKILLKWNAVPTLFSNCKKNKQNNFLKQETTGSVLESIDTSKEVGEENLICKFEKRPEVKMDDHTNNSSNEIAILKDALNTSQQEIRTLRTIISQLQAIIKMLMNESTD